LILQRIEDRLFDDMTRQIHHVRAVTYDEAEGLVAEVYEQLRRDFQVVPPLTLHSASPLVLAGAWAVTRESQIAVGKVARDLKEAVSGAVSDINECPYCVDAHTAMLHASSEHNVAAAIRAQDSAEITSARMRRIVEWAKATRSPQAPVLKDPPFSAQEAPEVIGTALAYHYVNRMVNIFLDDTPLPVTKPGRSQDFARRAFGATFAKRMVRRAPDGGEAVGLLPMAELPDDMAWAEPNPSVTAAYARFAAVIETAGERVLSPAVRRLVVNRVALWQGEDLGIGRGWVEDEVAELGVDDQPAGRLALLTALASYQVDQTVIDAFRLQQPSDADLIEVTAWASFQAARRIGTWIAP